jgi:hypothetical protein
VKANVNVKRSEEKKIVDNCHANEIDNRQNAAFDKILENSKKTNEPIKKRQSKTFYELAGVLLVFVFGFGFCYDLGHSSFGVSSPVYYASFKALGSTVMTFPFIATLAFL